jgi:hypothetical protein
VSALALLAVLTVPLLAQLPPLTPDPPAPATAEDVEYVSYAPAKSEHGVLVFRVDGAFAFTVRDGELRLAGRRQAIDPALLRQAARSGVLQVRPAEAIRRSMREHGRRRIRLRLTLNASLVPTRGVLLGAFHKGIPPAPWTRAEFTRFESVVGRRMDIDHRYHAWGRIYWPTAADRWDLAHGRVPMASLGGASSFSTLDAITAGREDAYIIALARRLRAFRLPILFRPLWEMNGDWMAWGGAANNDAGQTNGPAKYVSAWRRMHRIFARYRATNAVWVWSPNCRDQPAVAWNHWTQYYPGDAYVDWVGCDGYNRAGTRPGAGWTPWESLFGAGSSIYADYPQKPFMVAETGACEGSGDKGKWIDDARSAMERRLTNVRAFVWFDQKRACDWRVTSSPVALTAFRRMAADPYFNPSRRRLSRRG